MSQRHEQLGAIVDLISRAEMFMDLAATALRAEPDLMHPAVYHAFTAAREYLTALIAGDVLPSVPITAGVAVPVLVAQERVGATSSRPSYGD